jgi:hypothetical protein
VIENRFVTGHCKTVHRTKLYVLSKLITLGVRSLHKFKHQTTRKEASIRMSFRTVFISKSRRLWYNFRLPRRQNMACKTMLSHLKKRNSRYPQENIQFSISAAEAEQGSPRQVLTFPKTLDFHVSMQRLKIYPVLRHAGVSKKLVDVQFSILFSEI